MDCCIVGGCQIIAALSAENELSEQKLHPISMGIESGWDKFSVPDE